MQQKKISSLWQPAFPNVPMQTNMGMPILQPGITKYEFITLEFLKLIGKSSNFKADLTFAKNQAREFIDNFDTEAAQALEVETEKSRLHITK